MVKVINKGTKDVTLVSLLISFNGYTNCSGISIVGVVQVNTVWGCHSNIVPR